MSDRDALAQRAVVEALRLRSRQGREGHQAVCPVDLAVEEGVDVRFAAINTLEGMYAPDEQLILVGSLRPPGRRAYTCAHELGHHVFGHGLRIDELDQRADVHPYQDDAEYVADRFAAALLMPKLAILHAFAVRGWDAKQPTEIQAYTIATLLGVGYTTLLSYMEGTLRLLPAAIARDLQKTTPKEIRAGLLGEERTRHIIIVDEFWDGRPVDAEVGDAVFVPTDARSLGGAVEPADARVIRAAAPGIALVHRGSWRVEVRVARAGYSGLAQYRYLEETDDDG